MRVYIKDKDGGPAMCVTDAQTVVIASPSGAPLSLASQEGGDVEFISIADGERTLFEAIEDVGFTLHAKGSK